jgi:hypothetical protein
LYDCQTSEDAEVILARRSTSNIEDVQQVGAEKATSVL